MLNASFGARAVIRRLPRTSRRRTSLTQPARMSIAERLYAQLRSGAAAAHLLPSIVTRRQPAPEVAVARPLSGNRHGLLYRIGVTNILDWDWSAPVGPEYRQQSIRQEPRTVHAQLVYQID